MTDVSAQPPTGSGGRNPKAAASMARDRRDREIAVWAVDLMLDPHVRYRRHLEAHIAANPVPHTNDRKLLRCHLGLLAKPYALGILAVVWRHHCSRADAGGKGNGSTLILTRHRLGKALYASSAQQAGVDRWPKFLRRASRVVEAAITYGLMTEEKGRPGCGSGCKPLHGTKSLDEFMVALGVDFGEQVYKSLQYNGKEFCVSPNVKKRKGASKK
jgi:hypothetical protein